VINAEANWERPEGGEETLRRSFGSKYARLARLKAIWDPDNVLHLNQNIRPEGGSGPAGTRHSPRHREQNRREGLDRAGYSSPAAQSHRSGGRPRIGSNRRTKKSIAIRPPKRGANTYTWKNPPT